MIDVDPQDRGEPVGRVLAARHRVIGRSAISQGDVEIAVRPEGDRAAVVIFKRIVRGNPDPLFTARIGQRGIGAGSLESRDDRPPRAPIIGRIVNEEVFVRLILGVKGQAQQALFIAGVDLVWKLQEQFPGARGPLIEERPDHGLVLFNHEQEVRAVIRISHGNGPVEPELGKGHDGAQGGQALSRREPGAGARLPCLCRHLRAREQ